MITVTEYEYYAQAAGTTDVRPVTRVNYRAGSLPVRWCPFCDTSSMVDVSPVCLGCHALWLDGSQVALERRVADALGREPAIPVAPVAPALPTLPEFSEELGGYAAWTMEELANASDVAKTTNNMEMMLALAEELEDRHRVLAEKAAEPQSLVEAVADYQEEAPVAAADAEPDAPSEPRRGRNRTGR